MNWLKKLFSYHTPPPIRDLARFNADLGANFGSYDCPKCGEALGATGVCYSCEPQPSDPEPSSQIAPGKPGRVTKKNRRSIFDNWEITQDQ